MSSVILSVTCNRCKKIHENYWVTRDSKGLPSLEGAICGDCGGKNCLTRNWNDQKVNGIVQPMEDGQINRFEYSFTSEDGKRISKKMDPKMVEKHFRQNSK